MATYRRLLISLGVFAVIFVAFALMSQRVFLVSEGRPMGFIDSLLFVAETVTSTGFGSFIPFKSPATMLWAVFLMLAGFATMAVWLGAVVGDWMSSRLAPQPPTRGSRRLSGHVIICGTGPIGRYLARECRESGAPYVLIGQDRETLVQLMDQGYSVMKGDPRTLSTLRRARVEQARALVSVMADADNASICLVGRSLRADLDIFASLESSFNEPFLQAAGVTKSVMVKRSLGLRLGFLSGHSQEEQFSRIFGEVSGLAYAAVPIRPGDALPLTDVVSLGVLRQGRFRSSAGAGFAMQPGDLFMIAGSPGEVERVKATAGSREHAVNDARVREVLLLGFGDAGRGAAEFMRREGVPFRVLSRDLPPPGDSREHWGALAWTEGDATSQHDLLRAGLDQAGSVVIALPDDTATVFATLVVRQLRPGIRIVARANSDEVVERLQLAGADSALDLSAVGGVVLARQILPGDIPVGLEGLQMTEVPVGRALTLSPAHLRSGCRVVAVRDTSGDLRFVTGSIKVRVAAGEQLVLFGSGQQQKVFRGAVRI